MGETEVIVNELLCFITNKIDLVDHDALVLMCSKAFSVEDAVAAKTIMKNACTRLDVLGSLRIGTRTGTDKLKRDIEDIVVMTHKLDDAGPTFVAKDLRKLPPLSFDFLDVTHLLHRLEKLEQAAEARKEVDKKTTNIIEKLENELKTMKENEAKTSSLLQCMVEATPSEVTSPRPAQNELAYPPLSKSHPKNPGDFQPQKESKTSSNMVSLTLKKIQDARKAASPSLKVPSQGSEDKCPQNGVPVNASSSRYSEALRNGKPKQVVLPKSSSSNKKFIHGALENPSGVKAAVRSVALFTSWWSPNETCEGVKTFLKNSHNITAECEVILTRATKYKCFKISFQVTRDINLFDPLLWPLGVRVGKFYNRTQNRVASAVGRSRHQSAGP